VTEVHLVPLVRGLVDKYLLILLSFYTCAQHTQPISLGTVVDDIHNFKALWRWWSWGGNSINTNYKFAPTTLHPSARTYPGSIAADVLGPVPPHTSPDQVGRLGFVQHRCLL